MKIASEISSRQELNELKFILEIFVVNSRIRELTSTH
jgi:hypothetical protein